MTLIPSGQPFQVEQVGDVGHPRPVPRVAVGVDGGGPGLLGNQRQDLGELTRQAEPDRVGQPAVVHPVQEVVGGACGVGPDEHPASGTASRLMPGQLPECLPYDGDVVGGGVRSGVAGP
jgi:hypothetical protein